jgi:NADH dehydrogenase
MSERVVVLGAGYAGVTAVQRLERELDEAELTWLSEDDRHLLLHEVHRVVKDPGVVSDITVPVEEIAAPSTGFVEGTVEGVDTGQRLVELADGRTVDYGYLLIAIGSRTAFYGIPGLAEQAHTLKGLDDAHAIHDAVVEAAREATPAEPAEVVVGGAGLSGIQCAGEVAELRDDAGYPIEVSLVEATPDILPGMDSDLQAAVRRALDAADVRVLTDDPIVEARDSDVVFDERDPLPFDVLVWAGGITGREALSDAGLDADHDRVETDETFRTSDDRVFAVGDSALVEQDGDVAPPTAQAAWQAGAVAGENVARRLGGRPLRTWTHHDKGTVVSIGERAVAHDVVYVPVRTFGGFPAKLLKKSIAARWLADVHSARRALGAWNSL